MHRTQVIGVNFSGASLSESSLNGAKLTVTKLLGNLNEASWCQSDLSKTIKSNDNARLTQEAEQKIYYWNDLPLRSPEQVKIAEALDRANIIFIPNFKIRLTSTEGKENKEADFLIFYRGKSGILLIETALSQQNEGKFRECDRIFQSHGISIIQYYDRTRCSQEPDRVVQEFLELLSADINLAI